MISILIFLLSSGDLPSLDSSYCQNQNVVDDLASLYFPTSPYNRVQQCVLVSSEERMALARSASD